MMCDVGMPAVLLVAGAIFCSQNFVAFSLEHECFRSTRGLCYSIHLDSVDWFESVGKCTEYGGKLAQIEDKESQTILEELLSRDIYHHVSALWIGLRQAFPGSSHYVFQTDTRVRQGSYCATRGQGQLNCSPNNRMTESDCTMLGCCWNLLDRSCYTPNYVSTCQAADPSMVTECIIGSHNSRNFRRKSCLQSGCCWKDWPRLSVNSKAPNCFYFNSDARTLNFSYWSASMADRPSDMSRRCVQVSRESQWRWETVNCSQSAAGVGFLCEYDASVIQNTTAGDVGGTNLILSSTKRTRETYQTTIQTDAAFDQRTALVDQSAMDKEYLKATTSGADVSIKGLLDTNKRTIRTTATTTVQPTPNNAVVGTVVFVAIGILTLLFVLLIIRRRRIKREVMMNSLSPSSGSHLSPTSWSRALYSINPAYVHNDDESVKYEGPEFYVNADSIDASCGGMNSAKTYLTVRNSSGVVEMSTDLKCEKKSDLRLAGSHFSHTECLGYDSVPTPSAVSSEHAGDFYTCPLTPPCRCSSHHIRSCSEYNAPVYECVSDDIGAIKGYDKPTERLHPLYKVPPIQTSLHTNLTEESIYSVPNEEEDHDFYSVPRSPAVQLTHCGEEFQYTGPRNEISTPVLPDDDLSNHSENSDLQEAVYAEIVAINIS